MNEPRLQADTVGAHWTDSRGASYAPAERQRWGVIATLVDSESDEVRVVQGSGTTKEATREIAALCDARGPSWRVRSLSHPLSVYRDLINAGRDRAPQTEGQLLGLIGRKDLVEYQRKYAGLRTAAIRARRRTDKP